MYGDPLDYLPEVMELCLNCKYSDCFGDNGCEERQRVIREIRKKLGEDVALEAQISIRADYTIDGVTMSGYEWIKLKGKRFNTVYARLKKGLSFKEALLLDKHKTTTKRGFVYVVDGVCKKGSTWEKELGLTRGYIAQKIRRKGISGEDVIREVFQRKAVKDVV